MDVLWLPIFSMRSYETGQYAITKDGNFQLTMSRILASDFDWITIALPTDCSDFDAFLEQNAKHFEGREISFVFLKYGINAVETREDFWRDNHAELEHYINTFDLVITDITGLKGFDCKFEVKVPFINNFNITMLPNLDRPYIDRFWTTDLDSMRKAIFTTVINPIQRDTIVSVAPDLKDKVKVLTKVAHAKLMPSDHKTRIFTPLRTIFWPFRISDKAYQWNAFLEMFEANKLYQRWKLVITDPNDTYKGDHKFVTKIKLSKSEYYEMLSKKPVVVMLDDIDTVLHPGTIEFFYYGCPVITLPNELIGNTYQVGSIEQIPQILNDVSYNNPSNVRDFVYDYKEVCAVYNKNNINHEQN